MAALILSCPKTKIGCLDKWTSAMSCREGVVLVYPIIRKSVY